MKNKTYAKLYIKNNPTICHYGKISVYLHHTPLHRARHIGESVMLSFPHGNLVNFNLDGDAATTLTAWYSHAATCRREYTSVGLLFVTSKGFTRASMRLQAQAPHFLFTNHAELNGCLRARLKHKSRL